jgi:hypothetical protein
MPLNPRSDFGGLHPRMSVEKCLRGCRYERPALWDVADVSRTLPLAFLEPAIVEAVIDSRQPIGLTPRTLKRIGMLPCSWPEQRRRLGIHA